MRFVIDPGGTETGDRAGELQRRKTVNDIERVLLHGPEELPMGILHARKSHYNAGHIMPVHHLHLWGENMRNVSEKRPIYYACVAVCPRERTKVSGGIEFKELAADRWAEHSCQQLLVGLFHSRESPRNLHKFFRSTAFDLLHKNS